MNANLTRYTIFVALFIMILTIPIFGAGCEEQQAPPEAPALPIQLSSTLVPNMDLDLYAYVKQEKPTTVPKDILGTPSDVAVESLSFWGIPQESGFVFGGGLTFVSAADAANTYAAIPGQSEIWMTLSNQTIYFVQGSGAAAENLKTAISKNNFKYYDDPQALQEVALLPDSGTTKLVAVGIARPNETLSKLIAKRIDSKSSNIINTLITWARLELITAGLYAPQPINVTELAPKVERGAMWETDLGMLVSVKSGLPGFLVSPIVKTFLENAGYMKTNLGELTLYKGPLDTGNNNEIPVIFSVEGNRVFAALSENQTYAETLLTSINRH